MGLHNALQQDLVWGYWFYFAYHRQRGRRHLFRVPFVRRKYYAISRRDREYFGESEVARMIRDARRQNIMYFPAWFSNRHLDTILMKACNRTQEALEWDSDPASMEWVQPNAARPRAMCETCWNRGQELGTSGMLPRPGATVREGTGISSDMNIERFTTANTGLGPNSTYDESRHIQL